MPQRTERIIIFFNQYLEGEEGHPEKFTLIFICIDMCVIFIYIDMCVYISTVHTDTLHTAVGTGGGYSRCSKGPVFSTSLS